MKKFIAEMFGGGDTSIKRVIAFLGFLFIAVTMILNLYTSAQPSKDLIDSLETIVLVCIGGNVVEKFLGKKSEESK